MRVDKARFIPEESGRLVTAFLERFFERYVSYDYTAELEEELDDVSGGRLDWQKLLDDFWRDFKPKAGEVMDQKPSEITAALDEFLAPWLYPPREDGTRPARLPAMRQRPAVACAAASSARSSPAPIIPTAATPRSSARAATQAQSEGPTGARRRHRAQDRPLRALCRARRQARVDPEGRAARGCDAGDGRAAAVAAARDRRRIPRPASRSPPRSGATGPISPTTANMRSWARPPRCSRPA